MGEGANILSSFGGAFFIFVIIAIAVMIALRIMLPISIFKIRDLTENSLDEQKKTNELLTRLLTELKQGKDQKDTDERDHTQEPLD
jgi:uncharacterized membrane protein